MLVRILKFLSVMTISPEEVGIHLKFLRLQHNVLLILGYFYLPSLLYNLFNFFTCLSLL